MRGGFYICGVMPIHTHKGINVFLMYFGEQIRDARTGQEIYQSWTFDLVEDFGAHCVAFTLSGSLLRLVFGGI